jgi:Flp pilus assembly pilin Flp
VSTALNRLYSLAVSVITRMHRQEGQTLAEYGLLIAAIAVVAIAVAVLLGSSISALFRSTSSHVVAGDVAVASS